ncbi:hypothetical protein [Paenibacillus sp. DMB20]|uniref:hypothetical protein n=1 Tax=Paenibacillus sp. DMB20 TaxID=1642570 RepID=UPI00128B31D3|nr:hypothetical protein [Paenibacillus sp. DMB20]
MGESSSMPGKGTAYHSGIKAGAMEVKVNVGGTPGYGAYPGLGYHSAHNPYHHHHLQHYAHIQGYACPPVHCYSGRPRVVAAELVLFILLVIVIRQWQG